jgi:hypothetical protein
LTGQSNLINNHHRSLRSLLWSDDDYQSNVPDALWGMVRRDARALPIIESYL